jgi:hypothetical protein
VIVFGARPQSAWHASADAGYIAALLLNPNGVIFDAADYFGAVPDWISLDKWTHIVWLPQAQRTAFHAFLAPRQSLP